MQKKEVSMSSVTCSVRAIRPLLYLGLFTDQERCADCSLAKSASQCLVFGAIDYDAEGSIRSKECRESEVT